MSHGHVMRSGRGAVRRGGVAVEVLGLVLAVAGGLVLFAKAAQYSENDAINGGIVLVIGLVCMQIGARRSRRRAEPTA